MLEVIGAVEPGNRSAGIRSLAVRRGRIHRLHVVYIEYIDAAVVPRNLLRVNPEGNAASQSC